MGVWKTAAVIFAVLFVGTLGINVMTGMATQPLASAELGKELVDYVENKFSLTATINEVKDLGAIYEVNMTISSQGKDQDVIVYASKDGKYMVLGELYDLSEKVTKAPVAEAPGAQKLVKPQAELFIMTFCPYGTLAQANMKPVVDLLGDTADLKVRFITNIDGNAVNSLHGPLEANEDMRQACIRENYGQKAYWDYAYQVASYYNNQSEACWKESDNDKMSACLQTIYSTVDTAKWKEFAEKAGIDTAEVESCVSADAINLLKVDEALSNEYGVTGSPTLILNGESINAGRSPNGYLTAVCSGYTTQPAQCSLKLNDTQNTGSGSCN